MKEQKYRKKTLKIAGLSEQDVVAVGEAVCKAEKSTNGEIAAVLPLQVTIIRFGNCFCPLESGRLFVPF